MHCGRCARICERSIFIVEYLIIFLLAPAVISASLLPKLLFNHAQCSFNFWSGPANFMWLQFEHDNLRYPVSFTHLPSLGDAPPCLFYLLSTFSLFLKSCLFSPVSCTDSVAFGLIPVDLFYFEAFCNNIGEIILCADTIKNLGLHVLLISRHNVRGNTQVLKLCHVLWVGLCAIWLFRCVALAVRAMCSLGKVRKWRILGSAPPVQ